jgi:hypothetical protein
LLLFVDHVTIGICSRSGREVGSLIGRAWR